MINEGKYFRKGETEHLILNKFLSFIFFFYFFFLVYLYSFVFYLCASPWSIHEEEVTHTRRNLFRFITSISRSLLDDPIFSVNSSPFWASFYENFPCRIFALLKMKTFHLALCAIPWIFLRSTRAYSSFSSPCFFPPTFFFLPVYFSYGRCITSGGGGGSVFLFTSLSLLLSFQLELAEQVFSTVSSTKEAATVLLVEGGPELVHPLNKIIVLFLKLRRDYKFYNLPRTLMVNNSQVHARVRERTTFFGWHLDQI